MQAYDILMIAVIVGATAFGAMKGMAWQIASLASLGLSYLVSLRFSETLAPYIHQDPPWNKFAAMLILYLGTSLAIWMMFRMVRGFIDRVRLNEFDRQVGALFGAAKGVLVCIAITFFAVTMSAKAREAILQSRSGYYIAVLLNRAETVMPREFHEVLDPYLHRLEQELNPGYPARAAEEGDARQL